jgi:hypothetical protein
MAWDTVPAIHGPCVGVVTEYIHPLYTEWCVEAACTLNGIELGHGL